MATSPEQGQTRKRQSASVGLVATTVIAVLTVEIVLHAAGLGSVLTTIVAAVLTSVFVTAVWNAMIRSEVK